MKRKISKRKQETLETRTRAPLLVDRLLHQDRRDSERYVHPKAHEQMMRSLRSSHRFVFDDEAAERLAKVVIDIPQLLVRERQFARAPFDTIWIEIASHRYWETLREQAPEAYDMQGEWGDRENADHTVGYLIDHNRVNTIVGGTVADPLGKIYISPLQYQIHTEWPLQDQIKFAETAQMSRLGITAFMWGSSFGFLGKDDVHDLRNETVLEFLPPNPAYPEQVGYLRRPDVIQLSMRGAVGDVRTIHALLLMLNRPSITQYRPVNTSRGWYRSKPIPYLSHSVVHVDLDAVKTLRHIGTPAESGITHRRHEVRGHFCHDKTARDYMRIAGCIHEWRACDDEWAVIEGKPKDEPSRWHCAACGGKRWWREAHERGDASKGYVIRDGYEVTVL